MDTEKRDQVIEKIKKLLALSKKNNNENEKIAAALKAQKLIAEFSVEEYEYMADKKIWKTEDIRTVKKPSAQNG